MYKKVLFFERGSGSYGSCGSGSGSNIDNYLLGLVRNVSINSKPKKKG